MNIGISFALLSIPAYHFLALIPHAVAVGIATQGDSKRHDNVNPQGSSNKEKIKQRLSPNDYARYERAEACHKNHLENESLFIGAILAGVLAENITGKKLGTDLYAAAWLGIRVLYTALYINTTTRKWSIARSAIWGVGLFSSFGLIVRAAIALA